MWRPKCFAVVLLTLLILQPDSGQTQFSLEDWVVVDVDTFVDPLDSHELSLWVLSTDDPPSSVLQTMNAYPTYFLNGLSQSHYEIHGTFRCEAAWDNDAMGFVFGYQDPARCYVMEWNAETEPGSYYGCVESEIGFSIKKFHANSVDDLLFCDFWGTGATSENVTLLIHEGPPGSGWLVNTDYQFKFIIGDGEFSVIISEGAVELWNVTIEDDTYPSGQFGFYNFSLDNVRYSGVGINHIPICDAGGPYNAIIFEEVTLDASLCTDWDGTIVSYIWDFGDGSPLSQPSGHTLTPHTYDSPGDYEATLFLMDDQGGESTCQALVTISTPCKVVIGPDPFTPNSDGINDEVHFDLTCFALDNPSLTIYNLKGQELNHMQSPGLGDFFWNGKDRGGMEQKPGVYIYLIVDGSQKLAEGSIVLAR